MSAFENDEVLIPLAFFKWTHLYHLIDPKGNRIFNYHIHRLGIVLFIVAAQFVLLFGTVGVFLEMEDTVDATANIMLLAVFFAYIAAVLKISIIIIKAENIWNLLNVTRIQFLNSQHCRKYKRKLEEFKKTCLLVLKYIIGFYSVIFLTWVIYPLIANINIKINGNGSERLEDIYYLRYPVNTNTFNQYFWFFYTIEIFMTLLLIISTVIDTLILFICLVIIVQYEILQEAFASIGNQHELDKKSKLNYLKKK